MAKIKYTYGSQAPVEKSDGTILATGGKLMNGDLKGEVVLSLESRTVTYTTDTSTSGEVLTPGSGYDGFSSVKVIVQAGTSGVDNQALTITPTESVITKSLGDLDPGKTGYGPVTVNAIPNTYVGSSITRQSSANVEKTITVQSGDKDHVVATVTIPVGYYTIPLTISQDIEVLPSPTLPVAQASYILSGYAAYDDEGNEIQGTLPDHAGNDLSIPSSDTDGNITIPEGYYDGTGEVETAAATVKSGEATIADPALSSGKWTQTVSVAAPTVVTAGWISADKGTKQTNNQTTKELSRIAIGVNASSNNLVVTPVISKEAFSITDVYDAAVGDATTTAPASGVYVKVKSAASTSTATITPTVVTEGYGSAAAGGHVVNNQASVVGGANASADTYVQIKTISVPNPTATSALSGPTAATGTAATVSVPSGATIVSWVMSATPTFQMATDGYVVDRSVKTGSITSRTLNIPVFQLS